VRPFKPQERFRHPEDVDVAFVKFAAADINGAEILHTVHHVGHRAKPVRKNGSNSRASRLSDEGYWIKEK